MHLFTNIPAIARAIRRTAKNLVPPEKMLPSVWAERNVRIPVGNAIPGPISFANAPYQRGMLDAIKEPGIKRVSYMTGAQLGKTMVQQCGIGYFVDHEPRSQIFVQPTQGDVTTFQETKLKPMIDGNPSIKRKMSKARSRTGVNNSRIISYIGGWLMFSWAGSPKTLRGRSAPVTHADEIDGMEATKEGDPVELLAQRAATFGDDALRTESSTPTIKGASRIETAFEAGDQRRFYVPCPGCGHAQVLKWAQVQWDGKDNPEGEQKPETAAYACESCGELWNDGTRVLAIRTAEKQGHGWKAAKPFKGHASFHAPEMLSTFRLLADIVQSYLDKLAVGDVQSFINVSLGETYEETAEKADPDSLLNRREVFLAPVPMRGLYLTAGIDMQPDRLEVEIVAWGLFEENWSVDYRVLWGDPLAGDVWQDLDDLLAETFLHESGALLPISASCLDTGGTSGYTQCAYEYVKNKPTSMRIFAIKGIGGWGRAIVEKPIRKKTGKRSRNVDLFLVGTDEAKLVIMRRLAMDKPGPGYSHFPVDDAHESDFFKQLTAEKLVTRYVKGFAKREWIKPEKARNEALDCRVYALAALKIMNPSLKSLAKRLILDEKTGAWAPEGDKQAETEPAQPKQARNQPKARPVAARTEQNPQVDATAPERETRPIKRAKSLSSGRRAGGFVKNW